MGRKSCNTSKELRELIIKLSERGLSYRKIGQETGTPFSTVQTIIRRYKNEHRVEDKPKSGRPKLFTDRDERLILRRVRDNPQISAVEVSSNMRVNAHPESVRRVLKRANYNGRVARNKPYVSNTNRKKRIVFAKNHVHESFDFWENVIFTDESKFQVFGSDGRIYGMAKTK